MTAFVNVLAARIVLGGKWDYSTPKRALRALHLANQSKEHAVYITLDESFDLDFCGGVLLHEWLECMQISHQISQNDLLSHHKAQYILQSIQTTLQSQRHDLIKDSNINRSNGQMAKWFQFFASFQTNSLIVRFHLLSQQIVLILSFLGEIVAGILALFWNRNLRIQSMFYHIEQSLIRAVPIVSLACFLIGMVIAYQGALELQRFGASILIVEMSAILVLREMSPIIAAIIIAGRSASAFSAEIGMMKVSQEIDAMKTMGFRPIVFLVLPRLLALVLVFPLVVFIADLFGLLGSIVVSDWQLGIGIGQFLERFLENVGFRHLVIGMIKAPFFGFIIAFIGCYQGFIVHKDARSIGLHTTKAVVWCIFCVIAFDALCSVVFTQLGL